VLKERRLRNVLFVRKAICRLECLNKLVMYLVSLPVYVNVTHFLSCSIVGSWNGSSAYSRSNMAASATAIRDRDISVTTWGVRCHGNTFVADNSCAGTYK